MQAGTFAPFVPGGKRVRVSSRPALMTRVLRPARSLCLSDQWWPRAGRQAASLPGPDARATPFHCNVSPFRVCWPKPEISLSVAVRLSVGGCLPRLQHGQDSTQRVAHQGTSEARSTSPPPPSPPSSEGGKNTGSGGRRSSQACRPIGVRASYLWNVKLLAWGWAGAAEDDGGQPTCAYSASPSRGRPTAASCARICGQQQGGARRQSVASSLRTGC